MKAVSIEPVTIRASDHKEVVRAVLVASEEPATLPETGAGIEGMSANQVFAPFSILYVTENTDNKVFITNESGVFVAQ